MKGVENIVAKGDIAGFEHFFLLPQCFQKLSAAEASGSGYMLERVNSTLFRGAYYRYCFFIFHLYFSMTEAIFYS